MGIIYKKFKTLFLILFFFVGLGLSAQVPSQAEDVMLQGFGWNTYDASKWTTLESQAAELGANFDMIWLPPSGKDMNTRSMGYLPVYYFNQNSSFGTEAELKSLIQTLKANNVKAIADIVVNHRNGVTNWVDFPTETYNGVTYSWGLEAICQGDEVKDQGLPYPHIPQGAPDTGENYPAARDVDHTNTNVQNTIKAYLDFMKNEIGYDGWRYDLVKGFHGSYTQMYNNSANAYFSVGEYWDGNYDDVIGWIDATGKTSTAFDFPQKYALNEAFNNGYDLTKLVWKRYGTTNQPAGLVHSEVYRKYSVTFVDNHDTGRPDDGNSQFTGNVLAAYAFILSGPGIPSVWQNHWNNNSYKTKINELIAARKEVKLHNESEVVVNETRGDLYVHTATGKNGSLIVKIGTGGYNAPSGYTLKTSGNDYSVWTKVEGGGGQEPENPEEPKDPEDPKDPVDPGNGDNVIYFKKPTSWASNISVYIYDDLGEIFNAWPGNAATDLGDNKYEFAFDGTIDNWSVIFNDGANQAPAAMQPGFDVINKGHYTSSGFSHIDGDEGGNNNNDPVLEEGEKAIFFEKPSNWSANINSYIYIANEGGEYTSSWPGNTMVDLGNNVYKFTIDDEIGEWFVLFNDSNNQVPADVGFVVVNGGYYTASGLDRVIEPQTSTSISNNIVNGIAIYNTQNGVVINSNSSKRVNIYNLSGVVAKTVNLTEGANSIILPAGIYIVEKQKVIVK